MRMRLGWGVLLLVALLLPAQAADLTIADFYGTFEGEGMTLPEAGETPAAPDRVSGVEITPQGDGFSLRWTTMMMGETTPVATDARVKTSEQVFRRVGENVWHEVKNTNPGAGKPFAWARLSGDTLVVTTLILRDDGTYDMTSYERRLVRPDTMELIFTRFKNGDISRRVKAELKRKDG